jgi:hypothetical protein
MSSHEMPGYAIAATDGHHARLDERGYIPFYPLPHIAK